jgi:hypothetical protein
LIVDIETGWRKIEEPVLAEGMPSMTFNALAVLFPIVLAIHNIDEYAGYEEFIATYHARLPNCFTDRASIFSAATALTITAALVCLAALKWQAPFLVQLVKISICALLLNAFGHCALALKKHKWLPGTRSAVVFVLPFGALSLILMRTSIGDSTADLLRYTILGAITIPVVVAVFLCVGFGISRLRAVMAVP